MNINDMYKDAVITLDKPIGKNEFINCLNAVIRRLNSEAQKPIELITITGDAEDVIADLDDAINTMTDTIGEGERFPGEVEWDSVNYAVTLPRDCHKVLSVFYDDVKMVPVPYDTLKAEGTTEYYTNIGNVLYFNTDLSAAVAEIKIRAKCDYPTYTGENDFTGLPEMAYSLLLNGALFMLCARPRYYSELGLALYKGLFESALANYNLHILAQDLKSIDETAFYTY